MYGFFRVDSLPSYCVGDSEDRRHFPPASALVEHAKHLFREGMSLHKVEVGILWFLTGFA